MIFGMNPKELIGTAIASFGWLAAVISTGGLFEEVAAVVLLVAGIATAWYGSKQKVNLATATKAAETWEDLANSRQARIEDLMADKDRLNQQAAKAEALAQTARERIVTLESRTDLSDLAKLNEDHHQANLEQFARIGTLLESQTAVMTELAAKLSGEGANHGRRAADLPKGAT